MNHFDFPAKHSLQTVPLKTFFTHLTSGEQPHCKMKHFAVGLIVSGQNIILMSGRSKKVLKNVRVDLQKWSVCRSDSAVPSKARCVPFMHRFYQTRKEGMRMKKSGRVLVVSCSFKENGRQLSELMLECLRLFVDRNIR